jgi:hypothetical protein
MFPFQIIQGSDANVEIHPVMSLDDLKKGIQRLNAKETNE